MQLKSKRILAILLLVCMLISNIPSFVFAAPGDDGGGSDQGGSGATYDPGSGGADIETGEGSGATQGATKAQWAITKINGTFTPTEYKLVLAGETEGSGKLVGTYYDIDWTVGTRNYKNSKSDIDGFVKRAAPLYNMSEEEIRARGFEIHIYAQINARPPNGSYAVRTIKTNLNLLTTNNGNGTGGATWISRVVKDAAKNLGSEKNGWAYYKVPGIISEIEEDLPTVITSYVKVTGYDSKGHFILEEFAPTEKEVISLDDERFDKNTGFLQIEGIKDLDSGVAYVNDIITSPKDLTKAVSAESVSWLASSPETSESKINLNSQDLSKFLFGIISGDDVEVEVIAEPLANSNSDFSYTEQNKEKAAGTKIGNWVKSKAKKIFGTDKASEINDIDAISMADPGPFIGPKMQSRLDPVINKMPVTKTAPKTTGWSMQQEEEFIRLDAERREKLIKESKNKTTDVSNKINVTDNQQPSDIYMAKGSTPVAPFMEPSLVSMEFTIEEENPTSVSEEVAITKANLVYRIAEALEEWKEIPLSKELDNLVELDPSSDSIPIMGTDLPEVSDSEKDKDKEIEEYLNLVEVLKKEQNSLTQKLVRFEQLSASDKVKNVSEINELESAIEDYVDQLSSHKHSFSTESANYKSILEIESAVSALLQKSYNMTKDYISQTDEDDDYIYIEGNKNNGSNGVSLITNGEYNVAYLRYIVLPVSTQINVIDLKQNGVSTGTSIVFTNKIETETIGSNTYSKIHDIRDDKYSNADFNFWYTNDVLQLDPAIIPRVAPNADYPNDGSYDMTTLQSIENLPPGDNIYAFWEVNVDVPPGPSGDVPEWRISKYDPEFIEDGQMMMALATRDWGNYRNSLSPRGSYNGKFKTYNPNNLETVKAYNPTNMNLTPVVNAPWYHSKVTEAKSNSQLNIDSLIATVDFDANLNRVKAGTLGNYRVANWVATNTPLVADLGLHGITAGQSGVAYTGSEQETKVSNFVYRIENTNSYTHNFTNRYRTYDRWGNHAGYRYEYGSYTMAPTYIDYILNGVTTVFDRYKVVDTSGRMLNNVAPVKEEKNGKTTIAVQEAYTMKLYPEVAMLFENDKADRNIVFVSGDIARQIKPITFHSLEHKVFVEAKSVGTSVATAQQAKQTAQAPGAGIGNKQVVHKGAGLNSTFDIKESSSSSTRGYLEVKSYVLDIATPALKTAWGNAFNTDTVKNNFLNSWTFKGKGSSKLEVTAPGGAAVAYNGPLKINDIEYTKGSESIAQHKLTVRGGILTHVNGTAIATVKTSNPSLYEALEGMKLVGANKDSTVLATFERQRGKLITEDVFRTMATTARNNIGSDLVLNQGWYNEDTTQLVVTEYVTRYNVPNTMYADKLPMTINGLETPVNKLQFYTKISKGHVFLNYTLQSNNIPGLGSVKTFFEITTRVNSTFNNVEVNYGVPNVSISDTTGLF